MFQQADHLLLQIYRVCRELQRDRHWALANQLCRSTLSIPANIVEGSARRTQPDYLHFLHIALGSASETLYLLSVVHRAVGLETRELETLADRIVRGLQRLIDTTESIAAGTLEDRSPEGRRPSP